MNRLAVVLMTTANPKETDATRGMGVPGSGFTGLRRWLRRYDSRKQNGLPLHTPTGR